MSVDNKELLKKLKQLPGKVTGAISKTGRTEIGPLYVKAAQAEAPVDTGSLRDSLRPHVRILKGRRVLMTIRTGPKQHARPSLYIKFLESGTNKNQSNPFRARALERIQSRVLSIITETVRTVVESQ